MNDNSFYKTVIIPLMAIFECGIFKISSQEKMAMLNDLKDYADWDTSMMDTIHNISSLLILSDAIILFEKNGCRKSPDHSILRFKTIKATYEAGCLELTNEYGQYITIDFPYVENITLMGVLPQDIFDAINQ